MLATLIATLTDFFAPWNALYADSKLLETGVTSVHLVAMLLGGGIAIAADRDTLRAKRHREETGDDVLRRLHSTHRPVMIALVFLFASGFALAAADVETFAKSPVFLVKLTLVTLLLLNGVVLMLTERRLRRGEDLPWLWRRLHRSTVFSLFLWTCTAIAGAALVNAG
ncbi:MAG: hypothetical protein V4558_09790 [Gemmatimonadota bacterium]